MEAGKRYTNRAEIIQRLSDATVNYFQLLVEQAQMSEDEALQRATENELKLRNNGKPDDTALVFINTFLNQ